MGRLEEASDGRNILLFVLVLCPELARLLELRTATGLGSYISTVQERRQNLNHNNNRRNDNSWSIDMISMLLLAFVVIRHWTSGFSTTSRRHPTLDERLFALAN